ncbi:DUF2723 domain-containing protein [Candidatus Gottesmanbacteria bacterium]|nr:DUF2723 domain-containing protein [Candidatus Gottesmanbacteria bacterium]
MKKEEQRNYRWTLLVLTLLVSSLYLLLQVETIYGGDAGDLASAIIVGGIAHPPGYPLYTLLGVIITKVLSFGTYAWRIGFLSSIPAIFTVIIVFDLIFYLTKRLSVAFLGGTILTFVYPFWLYSEVVEVFALNNLFLVSLLWLLIHWTQEGRTKYLYLAALVFGLSLSHHHVILFLVPSLLYLLLSKRKYISVKLILKCLLFFILGLIPYTYVLIVAYYNSSAINWMGSLSLINFISLVTRARYGTFQSGGFSAHDPILRLLNIWAFFEFVYKDFKLPAVLLSILGIYHLTKYQKRIFISILLGFIFYLFFLFLASFPLVDNFMVATFERFILPLYILIIPLIAAGFLSLEKIIEKYVGHFIANKKKLIFIKMVSIIFFIYPLGLLILNYPRISILKSDFSAENLGKDIFYSLPQNSILFLTTDTPLFDTQYVYYAEKYRPDVKIIHLTQLYNPDDLKRLKVLYPDLELPNSKEDSKQIFKFFLTRNYPKFPIYSKLVIETSEGSWIPYGLVFRFIKNGDKEPSDEGILTENGRLWSHYQMPEKSSLARYQNLMLSDLLPIYAIAHQEIGFWAAKKKYSPVAEKHLLIAEKLYPRDLDSYIILTQSYIVDNRCPDAKLQIEELAKKNTSDPRIYFLQSINFAVCNKEKEKALFYLKLYEEKKNENDINLKKI